MFNNILLKKTILLLKIEISRGLLTPSLNGMMTNALEMLEQDGPG